MNKKTLLKRLLIVPLFLVAISSINAQSKPTISLVVWDNIARESDLKPAEFYLYRNGGDTSTDIVVYYEISGTARNGYDFNIRDNIRLTGSSGQASGRGFGTPPQTSLRIKPINNYLIDENKSVTIKLLSNANYEIDPTHNAGTITILDSAFPEVQFKYPSSSGNKSSAIKVVLSKPCFVREDIDHYSKEVKLNYSISSVVPNDRKTINGTLVIPANKTETDLILNLSDNNINENETVILTITDAENANVGLHNRHFYTLLKDNSNTKRSSIYDKIYGIILGSRGGSSLGGVVEWCGTMEQIEKLYGVFENDFLAANHYNVNWTHPSGFTEDGIERQKCIATAIIEKQDRITAQDLANIWKRDFDIYKMEYMTQPYDRILTNYLRWGVEIKDLPNPSKFGGFPYDLGGQIHLTSRVFHPVPAINAGDPEGAMEDTEELAKLYYEDGDDAIIWGGIYNAALSLAMLPGATVNSVIDGALKLATPEIRKEIEAGLAIADKYSSDPMDRRFREDINNMYTDSASPYYVNNRISRYPGSSTYENVTCAFAILKISKGDVPLAVKIANNRARDTDCTAASAGAIAGALTGTSTIPVEWFEKLDEGMVNNPYTVSHLTNEATAQYLYRALTNKLTRMSKDPVESVKKKDYLDLMRKSGMEF